MNQEQKDVAVQKPAEKTLRVALIASQHTLHEYALFLQHLLTGLADESIPVALICPDGHDIDSLIYGPVEVVTYPAVDLLFFGAYNRNRLLDQLARFRPTLLHCLCESRAELTRQVADRLELPYVLMVTSLQAGWRHLGISSAHCTKIMVPAKSIKDSFCKSYLHFAERVEQINIGSFAEETTSCFSKPSVLPSMVATDSLDHAAEFEDFFSAIRHLKIEGYEFMLVVMGSGRAERELRKLLTALDLAETVTLVPMLRSWRFILAAGDVFIQPRPAKAFNPLLLEAMSAGSAVAACKGGVDDLILEDRTAVVFDPDDELSIRAGLQKLFDRQEFARQLAKHAQDYVREHHSVSNMVSAILQNYRQAQQMVPLAKQYSHPA